MLTLTSRTRNKKNKEIGRNCTKGKKVKRSRRIHRMVGETADIVRVRLSDGFSLSNRLFPWIFSPDLVTESPDPPTNISVVEEHPTWVRLSAHQPKRDGGAAVIRWKVTHELLSPGVPPPDQTTTVFENSRSCLRLVNCKISK